MPRPGHRRRKQLAVRAGATLAGLALLGIILAAVWPSGRAGSTRDDVSVASAPTVAPAPPSSPPATTVTVPPARRPLPAAAPTASPATTPATPVTTPATPAAPATPATRSSCHAVVHIGDSTSESLVSADYLPNPAQRLGARYAAVGAVNQIFEISGARSIVETYDGLPNAYTVAQQVAATGYKGCWVVDMGVNDAADIAAGSNVAAPERIAHMMSVIGNQPVLWVAVKTLLPSGYYAEAHMQAWNAALLQACVGRPNMRVLNWASQTLPGYYIPDGIHYNSAGSAVLALALANGLAAAFPASGPSPPSCLVP